MGWWITTGASSGCGMPSRGWARWTGPAPTPLHFFDLEQPLVGWCLPALPGDGAWWGALCVYYNPTEQEQPIRLPDGRWKLLSDGTSSSLWRGDSRILSGEAVLAPVSATIFGLV